jgi:putative transposase
MFRAYKYLIKPTKEQVQMLEQHFGGCRFVYNWGLEQKTKEYQSTGITLTHNQLSSKLAQLKKDNDWLKSVNSQSLQSSLKNLDTAYTNFFRKKKSFPKFKSKKSSTQSFQCLQNFKVDFDENSITIPKIKKIKAVLHRKFEGIIKTITISKYNDKYYASILVDDCEIDSKKLKLQKENSIGLDLGLKHFVITSDGDKYDNPKYLRKS